MASIAIKTQRDLRPLVTVRETILRQTNLSPDLLCLFDGEQIEKMIFFFLVD